MAADAAAFAPPDFKRQLVRHRERLMTGVKDAAAAEKGTRNAAAHRAAAARGAREVAAAIRGRRPFADVAYEVGGIVHEMALGALLAAGPADAAELTRAAGASRFLGYTSRPFLDPESLASDLALSDDSAPREAYDAALTATTRLLAWIWKTAGGDASIVTRFPDSGGPYAVRGN